MSAVVSQHAMAQSTERVSFAAVGLGTRADDGPACFQRLTPLTEREVRIRPKEVDVPLGAQRRDLVEQDQSPLEPRSLARMASTVHLDLDL